jgi:hypothetical protein
MNGIVVGLDVLPFIDRIDNGTDELAREFGIAVDASTSDERGEHDGRTWFVGFGWRGLRNAFDSGRLDGLLDEVSIDAMVISSKHKIQYLFGRYRFFFFDHFDAIGVSRYLPLSSASKASLTTRPTSGTLSSPARRNS